MIILKNRQQIETIKKAGSVVREILDTLKSNIKVGDLTLKLAEISNQIIAKYPQAKSAFLGYNRYPASICVSINNEIVHGIPSDRKIKNGDLVSVDVGIDWQGFKADAAETFMIGEVKSKHQLLVQATKEALKNAIAVAKKGNFIGDISYEIQKTLEKAGFSPVKECTGHGIGQNLHEDPSVPNFGTPKTDAILKTGMVLAIEPMAVEKYNAIRIKADNWTIVTEDGGYSAHFEKTIAITDGEPEILT
ncbi:MAG TPA: type I methionyl aminopeptidase [Patescibacteria group bacterium]|uniref:Methionine aminopeptidase n=1 Tax=uncultured Berkelbacteria bacterium Rifle_16ft_4_minimus_38443 TaxID=1665092 RepID=A0A0H4TA03_9BACT|nr:methionine aminopeptidase, type I, methionyl aminopeptidase [uncultured Berkelbacteria bacterium Rifle_16ft_4_minimus_38443]HLC38573.1 type I methionyl aminopeptidase [Patescibacteria group bacterium]